METTEKNKPDGFSRGLEEVKHTLPMAEYTRCLNELRDVILTTEKRGNSLASYYSKLNGRTPLTIAEEQRIAEVFDRYGVEDWQGTIDDNQNETEK